MIINIDILVKNTLNYSREQCGCCGSMDTMVTDQRYRCWDCGYDSAYSWGTYYPPKNK